MPTLLIAPLNKQRGRSSRLSPSFPTLKADLAPSCVSPFVWRIPFQTRKKHVGVMKFHASSHLVLMGFCFFFLFSTKASGDTVKWQLRVTIDLAAHLEEWQLNQDKLASARGGISLHPSPFVQRAGDNVIVNPGRLAVDAIKNLFLSSFMWALIFPATWWKQVL